MEEAYQVQNRDMLDAMQAAAQQEIVGTIPGTNHGQRGAMDMLPKLLIRIIQVSRVHVHCYHGHLNNDKKREEITHLHWALKVLKQSK